MTREFLSATFSAKWTKAIGNVGSPYGSNIIEVSGEVASQYKYVAQFEGSMQGKSWTVVIWNNMGPDGSLGGWYGKACRTFSLAPGQLRYLAFDEDSLGGWAMAPGASIPIDSNGAYASTWGKFAFGSSINLGWSSFAVSAIAAQNAGLEVQGMKICDVITDVCSFITRNADFVHNAYTNTSADGRGIGAKVAPGPVRLSVTVDYDTENWQPQDLQA
ncbi:Allergen [Penicillium cataractarum]|uniref:Allergen n=1 Tax=Penicillium cataractarum TaxID=2100454 RepID=A0A9W9S0V6_9EURO|nr:Allergen [Penicillium cataractarum]KAJ5369997.1 Allergen [Penicillium cataractarum]